MENQKKVLNTLVDVQNDEEQSLKVEAYCGSNYTSGQITCGSGYSSGGTSSVTDDLDILI